MIDVKATPFHAACCVYFAIDLLAASLCWFMQIGPTLTREHPSISFRHFYCILNITKLMYIFYKLNN
jgi:hypothetical protein